MLFGSLLTLRQKPWKEDLLLFIELKIVLGIPFVCFVLCFE